MTSRSASGLSRVSKAHSLLLGWALQITKYIRPKENNMYDALTVMFTITSLFGISQIYSCNNKSGKLELKTIPFYRLIPLSYLSVYIVFFLYGLNNSNFTIPLTYFGSMFLLLDMFFGVVYVCVVYVLNSLMSSNLQTVLEKTIATNSKFAKLGYKGNYRQVWKIHFLFLLIAMLIVVVNIVTFYVGILTKNFISSTFLFIICSFADLIVLVTTYQFFILVFSLYQTLNLIYQILHEVVVDTNDKLKTNRLFSTVAGQF